ncbi:hypothetical protein PENTCL1PPCAC_3105, partial [Pristionchus entomophagus]
SFSLHFRLSLSSEEVGCYFRPLSPMFFCSFNNEEMKLTLLISVLIASLCAVSIPVKVKGTLTCSSPFYYGIKLLERDLRYPDIISTLPNTIVNGKTANYEISGMAWESPLLFLENEVEPLMMIEHNCGGKYTCICKDFGDVSAPLDATININLEKPNLRMCNYCMNSPLHKL